MTVNIKRSINYNGSDRLTSRGSTGGLTIKFGPPPPPSISTTNLALHYDAGNPLSYPGSGTTWTDLATARNVTLNGGVTYSADGGGSLVFGTNLVYKWGQTSSLTLNTGGGFTMEAIVKRADVVNSGVIAYLFSPAAHRAGLSFYDAPTNITWDVDYQRSLIVPDSTATGNWRHYTGVWSGGTATLYRNGVLFGSSALTMDDSTANVTLYVGGFEPAISDNYNPMNLAVVRYYERPLDAAEVLNNFNVTKARFGL